MRGDPSIMKWRRADIRPGNFGEESAIEPLVGGGSTHVTRYYQRSLASGDYRKTQLNSNFLFPATGLEYPQVGNAGIMHLSGVRGKLSGGQRDGNQIHPERLQVAIKTTWPAYLNPGSAGPVPTKSPWTTDVTYMILRWAGGGTPDQVDIANMFEPAEGKYPMSNISERGELIAWQCVKYDRSVIESYNWQPEFAAEEWTIVSTHQAPMHVQWCHFDIELSGHWKFKSATNDQPVRNSLWLIYWTSNSTVPTTNAQIFPIPGVDPDAATCFSMITYSEEPAKRLWKIPRQSEVEEAAEDLEALEMMYEAAQMDEGTQGMEPEGKRARIV